MTMAPADSTDPDLRAQFAAMRERDLAAAPEFEAVLARAAVRRTPAHRRFAPRPAWVAGFGVAAVAIAVWLIAGPSPSAPEPGALALPGWRTPTDSLLADAGDSLGRPSWAALPTAALGQPLFHPTPEIRR